MRKYSYAARQDGNFRRMRRAPGTACTEPVRPMTRPTGRRTIVISPARVIRRSRKSMRATSKNWTQVWSYRLRPDANSPAAGTMNEVTPLVVNGKIYLPAGNRVVALEAATGQEVWRYELKTGLASQRGVAYWPGDRNNPPRILFTTGHDMVALNANTGKPDPGFGNEGAMKMDVPFAGVPAIYKNIIVVGMNVFGPGEP